MRGFIVIPAPRALKPVPCSRPLLNPPDKGGLGRTTTSLSFCHWSSSFGNAAFPAYDVCMHTALHKTTRFHQRFENLTKAHTALVQAVVQDHVTELERAGLIQFFEMAFELSWKTLKDYLEAEGHIVKSPRETIKQAFANEIITDGHAWLLMLEDRNTIAHLYDEAQSITLAEKIRTVYTPLITSLHEYLSAHIDRK